MVRRLGVMAGDTSRRTLTVTAGTETEIFDLPGLANFAVIGTTGAVRTLTLQVADPHNADTWIDLALTVQTSTTDSQVLTFEDFQPYAGLSGQANLRFSLSASDSVEITLYGN